MTGPESGFGLSGSKTRKVVPTPLFSLQKKTTARKVAGERDGSEHSDAAGLSEIIKGSSPCAKMLYRDRKVTKT